MNEEQLDEIKRRADEICMGWLAAAPDDSPFRRYILWHLGTTYLFGILQAVNRKEEPTLTIYDALADTIGTILADAASRSLDPRDDEQVEAYLKHMETRIVAQCTRDIAATAKAKNEAGPPPGAH